MPFSLLQHDVTPVMRLILSIAPTGWRLHRVRHFDLDGPSKYRIVAILYNPAYFVHSPADRQQNPSRREGIFPTPHCRLLARPSPLPFPKWCCRLNLDEFRKEQKGAPSLPCQAAQRKLLCSMPRLAARCTKYFRPMQGERPAYLVRAPSDLLLPRLPVLDYH